MIVKSQRKICQNKILIASNIYYLYKWLGSFLVSKIEKNAEILVPWSFQALQVFRVVIAPSLFCLTCQHNFAPFQANANKSPTNFNPISNLISHGRKVTKLSQCKTDACKLVSQKFLRVCLYFPKYVGHISYPYPLFKCKEWLLCYMFLFTSVV